MTSQDQLHSQTQPPAGRENAFAIFFILVVVVALIAGAPVFS